MKGQRGNPGLKGQLCDKSVEAYILALEIINQLSIRYRVETFAYLVCNAWELLLKAKLLDDSHNRRTIYYPKKRGEARRTLSLRDCLKRVFPNEKDPVRRNVERVADLRDEAVHLIIDQVPKDVLGLFQACVLNYHRKLGEWFGISLSDRVSVGMMTIVYDLGPEHFDLESPVMRKRLSRDALAYLTQYQDQLRQDFEDVGRDPAFAISVDYRLALTKKQDDADIVLGSGPGNMAGVLIEVPKDPAKTHPYRQKELVDAVREELPEGVVFNTHDVQCLVKVHSIKRRPEWYYKGTVPGSPSQYSEAFRDWIVNRHKQDAGFLTETRAEARESSKPTQ